MSSLQELRKQIVQMAYGAGEGHVPSSLSILDIVWVLYDKILKPEDRFVLSKGHGCLALYVVLMAKGFISSEELSTFATCDSIFGGHPDRNKIPGVLCSTGSLGHGLPQAVGMALAKKIKGEPGRVFCLIGDGECNEGSIWEASLIAAHHNLHNLTVIIDYNRSTDRALKLGDLQSKFKSFEFGVDRVDGHNFYQISNALKFRYHSPYCIIADTIKGNGCKRMSDPAWHHRAPNKEELAEILQELSCESN